MRVLIACLNWSSQPTYERGGILSDCGVHRERIERFADSRAFCSQFCRPKRPSFFKIAVCTRQTIGILLFACCMKKSNPRSPNAIR